MFHRLLKVTKSNSFFIFGARGTGKTTYLNHHYSDQAYLIDLLEEENYLRYSRQSSLLTKDIEAQRKPKPWVIIDEIQRVPELLNVIHQLIEKKKYKFILTGSSARKLKRFSANLLAGRAFYYQMFPLTHLELADRFHLDQYLQWGGLPKIYSIEEESDRREYLRSYTQSYLKEEILQEQIVRNGIAFRNFLEIAAQSNGTLINFSKIANDIGIDVKTVQNYYQILEDTLIGFFLPAYHRSTRKSVGLQPKFYLFDLGIKRAIEGSLNQKLNPQTASYGNAFEHFIICETLRLNSYTRSDFSLFQYHTTAGGEIDLVLSGGRKIIAVEIKSSNSVNLSEVKKLAAAAAAINATKIYYVSQDSKRWSEGSVECIHWQSFFEEVFAQAPAQ